MTRFQGLALLLAVTCGLRVAYDRLLAPDRTAIPLRMPFSELPVGVLGRGWEGGDVPLDPETLRVAQVTSYLQRQYRRGSYVLWLYVGYVSGRTTDAIHHPEVCFPTTGLRLSRRGEIDVEVGSPPTAVPFKEHLWESATGNGTYTLSTFYYNGEFDPDETTLRASRLLGMGYFAVITMSLTVPGSFVEARKVLRDAAAEVVPHLWRHFPEGPGTAGTDLGPEEATR